MHNNCITEAYYHFVAVLKQSFITWKYIYGIIIVVKSMLLSAVTPCTDRWPSVDENGPTRLQPYERGRDGGANRRKVDMYF